MGTDTTAINKKPPTVDMSKLVEMTRELQKTMLNNLRFSGIEIRVDTELKGNRYYLVVSPEVYGLLQIDGEATVKNVGRGGRRTWSFCDEFPAIDYPQASAMKTMKKRRKRIEREGKTMELNEIDEQINELRKQREQIFRNISVKVGTLLDVVEKEPKVMGMPVDVYIVIKKAVDIENNSK